MCIGGCLTYSVHCTVIICIDVCLTYSVHCTVIKCIYIYICMSDLFSIQFTVQLLSVYMDV